MVDLKGVHKVTAKGRTYYYAWRGKGAPQLKAEPGSDAFVQELAAARAGRKQGDPKTIAGLCTEWKASDLWILPPEQGGLSASTKKNWRPWLDKIQDHFGRLSTRQFDRPQIRQDIKRWRARYKATPRAADMGKQVLSGLLSFAVEEGLISTNPCFGIANLYSNDRSDRLWEPQDLAALQAKASPEIMWAARLAAFTGLRQADLLRLSWSHIGALAIELPTGKSKGRKTALVPLYGALTALLAEIPKRSTRILTNTEGVPWRTGFGSSWNKALIAAGLAERDLHFHDLRGNFATNLYAADYSKREIAEAMGWSEDRVERLIDRYVRREDILRDKIRRLDARAKRSAANARRTGGVKPPVKPSA